MKCFDFFRFKDVRVISRIKIVILPKFKIPDPNTEKNREHNLSYFTEKSKYFQGLISLKNNSISLSGHPKWNEESHEHRIKNQTLRTSSLHAPAIEDFEKHEGTHILQSLDGFAIALNSDGRVLYISETVSIYLGLSQVSAHYSAQNISAQNMSAQRNSAHINNTQNSSALNSIA